MNQGPEYWGFLDLLAYRDLLRSNIAQSAFQEATGYIGELLTTLAGTQAELNYIESIVNRR